MRRIIGLLMVFGMCAGAAGAQVVCALGETPVDCWLRTEAELDPEREQLADEVAAAPAEEKEDLFNKPTGLDTGGLALGSNTKNFLPLLALSGLLGEDSDGDGVYVLDLNFLIPGLAEDRNSQLQAAINSKPALSEALAAALPEEGRDELAEELQGALGELDDYTLSFTYNWTDARHGRGFEQYRNRFASLTRAVSMNFAVPAASENRLLQFGEFIVDHEEELADVPDDFGATFEEIRIAIGVERMQAFKTSFEAALDQEAQRVADDRQKLDDAGLGLFADLVNNQPQLHVAASRRLRAPAAGGDETALKVTYEWSQTNLNSAMSTDCHRALDTADTSGLEAQSPEVLDRCLSEFTAYVTKRESDIKDGTRFSFSGEYLELDDVRIDLPGAVADLTLDGAKKVVISAGWTRHFRSGVKGGEPLRLDFVGQYEDVSDDPTRNDRGVATLTITQQVGGVAIPFGFVYANHGEFLPEVDEKLSAHIGLKFNLFPEEKE